MQSIVCLMLAVKIGCIVLFCVYFLLIAVVSFRVLLLWWYVPRRRTVQSPVMYLISCWKNHQVLQMKNCLLDQRGASLFIIVGIHCAKGSKCIHPLACSMHMQAQWQI